MSDSPVWEPGASEMLRQEREAEAGDAPDAGVEERTITAKLESLRRNLERYGDEDRNFNPLPGVIALTHAIAAIHQADTLAADLARVREERDEAMRVLAPNMPESGLVDACRQVKQAAISEADNAETALAALTALRETVRGGALPEMDSFAAEGESVPSDLVSAWAAEIRRALSSTEGE